ncbi:right-handed parallel beta-helix repeat-containing protein, partial [Alienimonas sp. DA493]|uniref:right-handed parallel beta-helix repeat-containing protein n=1 Tax=Alienimonas sp. DA493 TaxID=3373605 RepID=UPI003754FD7E
MIVVPHRRRPGPRALLAVVALLAAAPPAGARDWYVRKTGADLVAVDLGLLGLETNLLLLGSDELPFRTLGHTASFVEPGDRVLVGPGTYWDEEIRGGNASAAPVLWRPEAPGTATLRASAPGRRALTASNAAGHVFRGFALEPHPDGAASDVTAMLTNASAITLEDCTCAGGRWGVVLHDATAALTNYTYSGAGDGAYCFAGSELTATGCDVTVTDAVHSAFFARDSRLTLSNCTTTGGQNGVRYESGPGATVTDCTVADAVFGLLLEGDAAVVERCELLRCTTGIHLPAGAG